MSTYSIEVPFAPGESVWYCGHRERVEWSVCAECEGSCKVIVETRTGRYEVPCEGCDAGLWEGSIGKVVSKRWERVPQLVELGKPNLGSDGKVWYHRASEEQSGGTMLYADTLYRDRAECEKRCAELEAESVESIAHSNEQHNGRGRSEAARAMNWNKREIERHSRELAYHQARLKPMESRP